MSAGTGGSGEGLLRMPDVRIMIEPHSFASKRMSWNIGQFRAGSAVSGPIHRITRDMKLAERLQHRGFGILLAPQRGDESARTRSFAGGLLHRHNQQGMSGDLDEKAFSFLEQPLHRRPEYHGSPEVADPIRGRERRSRNWFAGDSRIERKSGSVWLDRRDSPLVFGEHAIHQGRAAGDSRA